MCVRQSRISAKGIDYGGHFSPLLDPNTRSVSQGVRTGGGGWTGGGQKNIFGRFRAFWNSPYSEHFEHTQKGAGTRAKNCHPYQSRYSGLAKAAPPHERTLGGLELDGVGPMGGGGRGMGN